LYALGAVACAQQPVSISVGPNSPRAVVIGFVGGFVHADDLRHSEIQLARKLQESYPSGVTVGIFENRERARARRMIFESLKSGPTADDNRRPNLILYGHSWGASAVVTLARELGKEHVPVSLTIQVDSIAKNGQDDSVIPANVAEAVNFYQTRGILHGRPTIRAADPARTRILGNFRFTYAREPAQCRAYPWYDRLLFKGHTSIECDPQVWSQVESLIRMRLPPISEPKVNQIAEGATTGQNRSQ
jgi:hypothetical protein